tara:strand:+ start:3041 stop:3331 length:291 start_codon:yes stop_codon:yes gene_type:complete
MKKRIFLSGKTSILLLSIVFLTSCAESPSSTCFSGTVYGFWSGLWHGIITPFAFLGSLLIESISFYAKNNDGSLYDFGFVLGISIWIIGGYYSNKL